MPLTSAHTAEKEFRTRIALARHSIALYKIVKFARAALQTCKLRSGAESRLPINSAIIPTDREASWAHPSALIFSRAHLLLARKITKHRIKEKHNYFAV
jgi:hypothetical protein